MPAPATTFDRIPPQSLEAERAALGAMLLGDENSREAIAKVAGLLKGEDFYRTSHQRIWEAIRQLFERGEKVDLVTVYDEMVRSGTLEQGGGKTYVAGLLDDMPLVSNVEEYVKIIQDKAVMRELMEVGHHLFGRAAAESINPEDLINAASARLYEMFQTRSRGGVKPIKELILQEYERIEKMAENPSEGLTGLPTGFNGLDDLTSGLQAGELFVLAARPSMGKSSFALNVAEHVALTRKVPVILFSLEMTGAQLVRRLLSSHARVDGRSVMRGQLYGEDRHRLLNAAGVLDTLPIVIDESGRLTPLQVRARARRVLAEHHATDGLIIIDYLQMMEYSSDESASRPDSRQQEITAISRTLKDIAKELKVPLLALSQLNRSPERRDSAKPRLSDLRESGSIEQDADVVAFIWSDPKDQPEAESGDHQGRLVRITVAKQRNGPTGTFQLYFNRMYTRFDNLDTLHYLPEDD